MTITEKFAIPDEAKARLKAKVSVKGRRVLSELALEFMDDDFVKGIEKFLSSYKPEDMATLITENKFIDLGQHLTGAKSYKSFISAVPLQRSCEIMYGLISRARPDLAAVIAGAGDRGAVWLVGDVKYMREKILLDESSKKELPKEEKAPEKKIEFTRATCDKCQKVWLVLKEEAGNITRCPFCGEVQEATREEKDTGQNINTSTEPE